MQVSSLGNSWYYLLFVDDFTRMSWVYFLTNKSEAFAKFKIFKAMVEKESRRCIKVLRSDRGGEFCSHEFNSFCSEAGIKRELTAPYTPQHNGVVKRKNRTIMGLARSMLFEKQVPKCFWAEAVSTAVYTMNRSPTKALVKQTPLHAWSGKKPTVGHMRAFGCIAYGITPTHHKQKLDQRSEKQIFIGYTSPGYAYKLYNPKTKKFLLKSTSDVQFLENQKWEWSIEGTSNVRTQVIVTALLETLSQPMILSPQPIHLLPHLIHNLPKVHLLPLKTLHH
ncbi:putative RNA-directed DNA polymerase [Helianthus annuus]|nr:putative RNA-directed DNA polymerase [Helianthus annuus]